MTPGQWSATAAWVAILVGVIAATLALLQLRDARRIRREQAAPYVIVQFEGSEADPGLIDFVVRNIGTTPAFDVQLSVSPEMVRAEEIGGYPFMMSKPLRAGIRMLAPQQEIRMYFDSVRARNGKNLDSEWTVTVSSRDSRGRRQPDGIFALDTDWARNSLQAEVHNLHWISHRIDRMDKNLKVIASSLRAIVPPLPPREPMDEQLKEQLLSKSAFRDPATEEPSAPAVQDDGVEDASNA
jgi:hypothetical protein